AGRRGKPRGQGWGRSGARRRRRGGGGGGATGGGAGTARRAPTARNSRIESQASGNSGPQYKAHDPRTAVTAPHVTSSAVSKRSPSGAPTRARWRSTQPATTHQGTDNNHRNTVPSTSPGRSGRLNLTISNAVIAMAATACAPASAIKRRDRVGPATSSRPPDCGTA